MVSPAFDPREPPGQPAGAAEETARLARALRERILLERLFGWDPPFRFPPRIAHEPPPPAARAPVKEAPSAPRPDLPQRQREAGPAVGSGPGGDPDALDAERRRRQALLDPIDREVRACRSCVLCEKRTRTVFGVGDPCARLMFVGEGPGEDEDRQGEPFVGRAGQLLTRMIEAMALSRNSVYIANIVKCRPPGNRNPEPREIISCLPYLKRQVEVIGPELICTLGNIATRALLQTQLPISRLRGRFAEFQGIAVLPTFHPSYLLRNPDDKRLAWEDLKKVMERLGLPASRPA